MKKRKRNRGISHIKSRCGLMFTLPWFLGIVIFFAIPFFQTCRFSFSDITVTDGLLQTDFVGLKHYKYILFEDNSYTYHLRQALIYFLYSMLLIILLSMVLALLLNQKFRGRLFFRALYFLPVIIATGEVINMIFINTGDSMQNVGISETMSAGMINVEDITEMFGFSGQIADYVTFAISKIFDLVWSCGIQTILILAGLQSIPSSLYEVSRVEGATKWEEFWFITFPMLSRVTLLTSVFTMTELITSERGNQMVTKVYGMMRAGNYDETSARILFYLLVSGVFIGIFVFAYNRFLVERWND